MASTGAGSSHRVSEAPAIRDAASLILLRRDGASPRVLMGQRGTGAVFMPDKFVFPGGALDPGDLALSGAAAIDPGTAALLARASPPEVARALPLTAVRELWEETGLRLAHPAPPPAEALPAAWQGFFASGARPRTEGLRLVFRAVTPPGRPRRFDARFFLAPAEALLDDPDAFTPGDCELANLCWLDIAAARALPLPFITTIVLSEVEALIDAPGAPGPVPFFHHDALGAHVRML